MVGAVGKFWILALLKDLKKRNSMICQKRIFRLPKKGAWPLCLPPFVRGPCLFIYSIFILFLFLRKYNCKIDLKSKALVII